MTPDEIAEEFWNYVRGVATVRGYIFTMRCEELTRDFMANAAYRLGEKSGVPADVRRNVDRFLGLMMEGAVDRVLRDQDFSYAMAKFCPLFPFC